MKNRLLFFLVSLLLIPSCKNQPTSNVATPSIKDSHTTEAQRKRIQKRLTKVLNNSSSVEEIKEAVLPYLGVLYEYATDSDTGKRLYSELSVNVLASNLIKKEQDLIDKGESVENVFLDIRKALFDIDNHWSTENENGTIVIHHDRLVDWNKDGNQFFSISVWQRPDAEPIVSILFPMEATGTPTAFFSDIVDGEEHLDNLAKYELPSWNGSNAIHSSQHLTQANSDFLNMMLNNEFMYLCYRAKGVDNIETVKVPLSTFQIAYRDNVYSKR